MNHWGKGPTVMLVHGWSGRGAQLGELVEPLVAAGDRPALRRGALHFNLIFSFCKELQP